MGSPPASGLYFYDIEGRSTEPLYKAMMECVLSFDKAPEKREGLKEFVEKGYFLIDATYVPVNKKSAKSRKNQLLKDYNNLVKDLYANMKNNRVKIILVKSNLHKLLIDYLVDDGFDVANKDTKIPFPSHGWQPKFCVKLNKKGRPRRSSGGRQEVANRSPRGRQVR